MAAENNQVYDPSQLVRDVVDMLQDRGLSISFPDGRQAPSAIAASTLLRSLGIAPGIDAATFYSRSTEDIWGENQDVG